MESLIWRKIQIPLVTNIRSDLNISHSQNPVLHLETPDSRGFTLVEIMVTTGLMAIAGLALTSMFQMNSKALRNTTQQSDALNLASLIQLDMNVAVACNATLLALPTASLSFSVPPAANLTIPVPQILTGTVPPQTVAAVAPATPNTFNSVVLSSASSLSLQNFTQTGPNNFTANLVVAATALVSSSENQSLGAQKFTKQIPVGLNVTISAGTATITGCSEAGFSSGSNANGYWEQDPTGLIRQWNNNISLPGDQFITFPTPFTNAASINVQIVAEGPAGNTGYLTVITGGTTTTGFQVHLNNQVPLIGNWYAIGY